MVSGVVQELGGGLPTADHRGDERQWFLEGEGERSLVVPPVVVLPVLPPVVGVLCEPDMGLGPGGDGGVLSRGSAGGNGENSGGERDRSGLHLRNSL